MLDFGFSEILLTSVIALVVLGPERLPRVARQVGHWMGRARAMARQLSEQLDREISADDLIKQRTRPDAPGNVLATPPAPPPIAADAMPSTDTTASPPAPAAIADYTIKPPQ